MFYKLSRIPSFLFMVKGEADLDKQRTSSNTDVIWSRYYILSLLHTSTRYLFRRIPTHTYWCMKQFYHGKIVKKIQTCPLAPDLSDTPSSSNNPFWKKYSDFDLYCFAKNQFWNSSNFQLHCWGREEMTVRLFPFPSGQSTRDWWSELNLIHLHPTKTIL